MFMPKVQGGACNTIIAAPHVALFLNNATSTVILNKMPNSSLIITDEEILNAEYNPPPPIVENLLYPGVGILASKSKIGKTIFTTQLARSIVSGEKLFDRFNVISSQVLYISLEDTSYRTQKRLITMGHKIGKNKIHFAMKWQTASEGGIEKIDEFLEKNDDIGVVIIDTLQKFRGSGTGSSYKSDYEIIGKLKDVADAREKLILLLHHTRKESQKDVFDGVLGSTGIPAALDTIMVLARDRGASRATLSVTGRDIEENVFALEFDKQKLTWSLLGDAVEVDMGDTRKKILELLRSTGQSFQIKDIKSQLGIKHKSLIHKLLQALIKDGFVKQVGGKGGPYEINTEDKTQNQGESGSPSSTVNDTTCGEVSPTINTVHTVNAVNVVNSESKIIALKKIEETTQSTGDVHYKDREVINLNVLLREALEEKKAREEMARNE